MVLLRSLPEFSTMCISAIDLLGDVMSCKGSVFGTIDCNQSAWCDSRDEGCTDSTYSCQRTIEEDQSNRYGDLLDTQSLSSSVHNLIHDSSERSLRHAKSPSKKSNMDIFRPPRTAEESSRGTCSLKLNRCTAWVQDDYSFESECPIQNSEEKSEVRVVHWEDRVIDSNYLNNKNGLAIFRKNNPMLPQSRQGFSLCKLERCTAWSVDDSSWNIENGAHCARDESPVLDEEAKVIHWDELGHGPIQ